MLFFESSVKSKTCLRFCRMTTLKSKEAKITDAFRYQENKKCVKNGMRKFENSLKIKICKN